MLGWCCRIGIATGGKSSCGVWQNYLNGRDLVPRMGGAEAAVPSFVLRHDDHNRDRLHVINVIRLSISVQVMLLVSRWS
jgi:hypothetical protein